VELIEKQIQVRDRQLDYINTAIEIKESKEEQKEDRSNVVIHETQVMVERVG
jgi:hypothetical protein